MENLAPNTEFRIAQSKDQQGIWEILQWGIALRKSQGSTQWQDGYPNENTVLDDLRKGAGYVLLEEGKLVGYCAIFLSDEPAYENLEGEWLTEGDFFVVHRIGISKEASGKSYGKKLLQHVEAKALRQGIHSIKVDTNFDNQAMLAILKALGYHYCGQVYFRGSARRAYEKVF